LSLQETTLRLINEHGVELPLTRKTGGDIDPISGKRPAETVTTLYPHGLAISDKTTIAKSFSSVSSTDKVYMMDASVDYQTGDKIKADGQMMAVKETEKVSQGSTPVYYMVRLVK